MNNSVPTSPEEWSQYWQAKGFPWRTEPEIDAKRQEELSKCRAILPDIEKEIYPFKGMKLSRADVEWLLATHENRRGPIDWNDEGQREREGLDLRGADLGHENLSRLPLARMRGGLTSKEWMGATEELRDKAVVNLEGANLGRAQLQGAFLLEARLQEAKLYEARLQGANLREAQLDGVDLKNATLSDGNYGSALLADIRWGKINLAVVNWTPVKRLGDEPKAHQWSGVEDYQAAVRANRQLAVELQTQGLNEDAARFAYRAQVLQRKVFWKQWELGKWLFSLSLALLTGYGYRMWRILVAYVFIVLLCAVAYFVLGMYYEPHLSFLEAVLTSITAFHGRVFSEPFLHPGEPQLWVTAFEAVMGLVIEGVFIAMLTQKFFGK